MKYKEREPDPSMEVKFMPIDTILEQLSSIAEKAHSSIEDDPDGASIWQPEIDACEAATEILSVLQDEGVNDPQQVRDLIYDYNALAKQYSKMHQKHEVAGKPFLRSDGIWRCPDCKSRAFPNNSFCPWCGKKLGGW